MQLAPYPSNIHSPVDDDRVAGRFVPVPAALFLAAATVIFFRCNDGYECVVVRLPAHDFVRQEYAAHLRVLVLALVRNGLEAFYWLCVRPPPDGVQTSRVDDEERSPRAATRATQLLCAPLRARTCGQEDAGPIDHLVPCAQ